MRLLLGKDQAVAAWVGAQIGVENFGPSAALGVIGTDGALLAGVVFHNYQPRYRSIEVSCAASSARWLTRPLIRSIMSYPFTQLECQRVAAVTPKRNRACRRFLETFGFKREGLGRLAFGDDDGVLYALLKREWTASRWMTAGSQKS